MTERGLQGSHAILWAPGSDGPLKGLLRSFLRLAPPKRPAAVVLLSPLPLYLGATEISRITDLWSTPPLSEQWSPVVRDTTSLPYPFEQVTSTPHGNPLQRRQAWPCPHSGMKGHTFSRGFSPTPHCWS